MVVFSKTHIVHLAIKGQKYKILYLQHCSDVWAISRSDLDSSKYAVFEGFTNQNVAKNQKLIFFLNVLILFMVYWDGPMSLVKLGWTTSSKYSFERNILTAIWSSWIYKAKLIFSPWFHLYFRPSQLHQIYRSSLGNRNQYNFFGKNFLVCDFSDFRLDEACRKVS